MLFFYCVFLEPLLSPKQCRNIRAVDKLICLFATAKSNIVMGVKKRELSNFDILKLTHSQKTSPRRSAKKKNKKKKTYKSLF